MNPSAEPPLVAVVIVSYNSVELLDACLASVSAHAGVSHEVIVVDNASEDGTVATLAPKWPDVRWIENRENRGFARANNQGFRESKSPFWLLLNPDARLEPGCLKKLLECMRENPGVAIAGPEVRDLTGRIERTAGWSPGVMRETVEAFRLFMVGFRGRLLRRTRKDATDVDWVSGCVMLVRADAAHSAGALDERFFMYLEDMEWGIRFRRAGWRVVHLRTAYATHLRSASAIAAGTLINAGDGLDYLLDKHRIRIPRFWLRALAVVDLTLATLLLGARGLMGDVGARRESRRFAKSLGHALGRRRGR